MQPQALWHKSSVGQGGSREPRGTSAGQRGKDAPGVHSGAVWAQSGAPDNPVSATQEKG